MPTNSDVVADFNSDLTNWYFGTAGKTPAGKFALVTVMMHELGPGLGFIPSFAPCGWAGRAAPSPDLAITDG